MCVRHSQIDYLLCFKFKFGYNKIYVLSILFILRHKMKIENE